MQSLGEPCCLGQLVFGLLWRKIDSELSAICVTTKRNAREQENSRRDAFR